VRKAVRPELESVDLEYRQKRSLAAPAAGGTVDLPAQGPVGGTVDLPAQEAAAPGATGEWQSGETPGKPHQPDATGEWQSGDTPAQPSHPDATGEWQSGDASSPGNSGTVPTGTVEYDSANSGPDMGTTDFSVGSAPSAAPGKGKGKD
jgi:hypothetical protein